MDALSAHGFLLRRRGGPGDAGVDLIGRFEAPGAGAGAAPPAAVPVLAQCKAEAKALGPVVVREFEGVLALHARSGAAPTTVGLIASASPFSPASRRLGAGSPHALLLLHMRPSGEVVSLLASRAAHALPAAVITAMMAVAGG